MAIITLLFFAIWLTLLVGSGVASISCLAGVFRAQSNGGRVGWFVGSAITGMMALGLLVIPLFAWLSYSAASERAAYEAKIRWEVESTDREYRSRSGSAIPNDNEVPNFPPREIVLPPAVSPGDDAPVENDDRDGIDNDDRSASSAEESAANDKPPWAIDPPDDWTGLGASGTEYLVLSAGPHQRWRDCEQQLHEQTRQALAEYIDEMFDEPELSGKLDFSWNDFEQRLNQSPLDSDESNEFREQINSPTVGPMFVLHRRLIISPEVRDELHAAHHEYRVAKRLKGVAAGSVGMLALLTIVYGSLKWKHAPRRAA